MSDAAWAASAAIVVAVISTIVSPLLTRRTLAPTIKRVEESHHALTVNHHSSKDRTIVDRLSDIESIGRRTEHRLDQGDKRMNYHEAALGIRPFVEEPYPGDDLT